MGGREGRTNVVGAEEELTREVGLLDTVHVCHVHRAFFAFVWEGERVGGWVGGWMERLMHRHRGELGRRRTNDSKGGWVDGCVCVWVGGWVKVLEERMGMGGWMYVKEGIWVGGWVGQRYLCRRPSWPSS